MAQDRLDGASLEASVDAALKNLQRLRGTVHEELGSKNAAPVEASIDAIVASLREVPGRVTQLRTLNDNLDALQERVYAPLAQSIQSRLKRADGLAVFLTVIGLSFALYFARQTDKSLQSLQTALSTGVASLREVATDGMSSVQKSVAAGQESSTEQIHQHLARLYRPGALRVALAGLTHDVNLSQNGTPVATWTLSIPDDYVTGPLSIENRDTLPVLNFSVRILLDESIPRVRELVRDLDVGAVWRSQDCEILGHKCSLVGVGLLANPLFPRESRALRVPRIDIPRGGLYMVLVINGVDIPVVIRHTGAR